MGASRRGHWAWLLLGLWGCGTGAGEPPPPPASLETNPVQVRRLEGVETVAVEGFRGPGGRPFEARARRDQVGLYPCATCHEQALLPPPPAAVERRWAHRDIRPVHPQAGGCRTCHDYGDLERLRLAGGKTANFDHVYQLCARCHFQQARDWAGGAHGKRLGGWTGRRVVMNCTGCHDPHAPAFAPRIPERGPRVPRTGRGY